MNTVYPTHHSSVQQLFYKDDAGLQELGLKNSFQVNAAENVPPISTGLIQNANLVKSAKNSVLQ